MPAKTEGVPALLAPTPPFARLSVRRRTRKREDSVLEYENVVWCGLDLGMQQDFSVLAGLNCRRPIPPKAAIRTVETVAGRQTELVERSLYRMEQEEKEYRLADRLKRYELKGLKEWDLGTPYTKIVEDVVAMFAKPPLSGGSLIIDNGGPGPAVVAMFNQARTRGLECERCHGQGELSVATMVPGSRAVFSMKNCPNCEGTGRIKLKAIIRPITITAGHGATEKGAGWNVSKHEIVSCMVALFDSGRLQYDKRHPLTAKLIKQLDGFRMKITKSANETFEAWRESIHDDIIMAIGLATWASERGSQQLWVK